MSLFHYSYGEMPHLTDLFLAFLLLEIDMCYVLSDVLHPSSLVLKTNNNFAKLLDMHCGFNLCLT